MQIVILHSTTLTSQKAHWVQIINTAHALARVPGAEVWLLPRTFEENMPEQVLRDMGFPPRSNLHFVPTVPHKLYKTLKLQGDLLSTAQGRIGRFLARRTIASLFAKIAKSNGQIIVLTRNEDLLEVGGDIIRCSGAIVINELHKFEYVKVLEGKLKKKRPGRRTLAQFKRFARGERDREIRRLSGFDGVICTTPNICQRLHTFGIKNPTIIIPNGANIASNEAASPDAEKDLDILYVGQLYRWKNVDLLIEALSHLPNKKLTIVGGDQEEDFARLRARAHQCGVANRVEFLGHQPHVLVQSFMRRAKVGVVPLPRRGFAEARLFCCPLKALEMMAASTPIVATRLRSVEGLLESGRNALLVAPDDARAMAQGILQVMEDTKLAERLIAGGLETARELSYDGRAQKIISFAEKIRRPRDE